MQEAVGYDSADLFPRKTPAQRNMAVSTMSRSPNRHCEANGGPTVLEALGGLFYEFFVVVWPCEIFDVRRDVFAEVCLSARIRSITVKASSSRFQNLKHNRDQSRPAVRISFLGTPHHATTSIRIPVLSP
jgi:hypothetical protein